jgi:Ice-binding-like
MVPVDVVGVGVLMMQRRQTTRVAAVLVSSAATLLIGASTTADAAIVPTISLATAANYAVLGGQTVTNTGPSILNGSLGLWPGTAISGFPPGQVLPPGTTDTTNAVAQQAQSDLTAAYLAAAGRPINATEPADLSGLTLVGGVYAGPSKSALSLNGTLILDGAGDPNSVFIFQTNSTLITGSSSTVTLINGAQECNVFWQVGSSATLGTGSVFAGNILALTSISVTTGVTVHGRALARNGAVTLDTDTFTRPTCAGVTGGPGGTVPGGGPGVTIPGLGSQTETTVSLALFALLLGATITAIARRKTAPD